MNDRPVILVPVLYTVGNHTAWLSHKTDIGLSHMYSILVFNKIISNKVTIKNTYSVIALLLNKYKKREHGNSPQNIQLLSNASSITKQESNTPPLSLITSSIYII